jgi:hypothetical protein
MSKAARVLLSFRPKRHLFRPFAPPSHFRSLHSPTSTSCNVSFRLLSFLALCTVTQLPVAVARHQSHTHSPANHLPPHSLSSLSFTFATTKHSHRHHYSNHHPHLPHQRQSADSPLLSSLSTILTASSPPLIAFPPQVSTLKSASIELPQNDRPYSDWSQSYSAHASLSSATLVPPPYLLNVIARPSQFTVSRLPALSDSDLTLNRPLNDQQWSDPNVDPTSTNKSAIISDEEDHEELTEADFNWFERLRAKLTGRTLGSPMNSTSIALLNKTRLQYYSDYDVMMGVRVAVSLSTIISLFALFITYKSYCNARKQRLRSSVPAHCESANVGSFSRASRRSRSASTKANQSC